MNPRLLTWEPITLAGMPRERRDTLFLLAVLGWTMLPHGQHLPAWTIAFAIALLGWRARIAVRSDRMPGRWIMLIALVGGVGGVAFTERTLWGRDAGVALLVVLTALKTLELHARRDAMVVFFLGFFLVLTNFLFSQSLLVAVAMVGSVWGLLTALTLAHMPNGHPSLRDAALLSGRAAVFGMPIMVVLFLLFPRIGPLWGVQGDSLVRTGLSDSLQMGSMAEIANDDSVALRIRFPGGAAPPASELYFRGPVLSRFDGQRWAPPADPNASGARRLIDSDAIAASQIRLIGTPIDYEMTLEPLNLNVLPLLELTPPMRGAAPVIPGITSRLDPALQWRTDRTIASRQRFTARAWLRHGFGPLEDQVALRDEVDLPPGYNPRSLEWAAAMRRDPRYAQAPADVVAQTLLAHIRTQGFIYTLAPGRYGRDAVDEFWFDRRAGFCEHFAASFVVMMRALDVPARIVTGFQGADPIPLDGYTIVRRSHAHAWAEYWAAGRGWVRVDPTAAVAPDRIQLGLALAPERGFVGSAIANVDPNLLRDMRDLLDAMNNRWNQWVLDYSRDRQFKLLEALGVSSPGWDDLAYVLIGVLSSASLAGAAWAWWDRRRLDPSQRLRLRLRTALRRAGVAMADHDTPAALAARALQRYGSAAAGLAAALAELERLRYATDSAGWPDRPWWQRFENAAADLARRGDAAVPPGSPPG